MTHSFDDHWPGELACLGDFALQYASFGYRVLPLARGGKKPHKLLEVSGGHGGVHQASTDRAVTGRWWHAAPHANIGVATGGGLAVLDLDVKNGVSGHRSLHDVLNVLGCSLDGAALASTPSGGTHIWMSWPGRFGKVPGRIGIAPGVDVKGDGGYVVVPPSGLVMERLSGGQDRAERIVPYSWDLGCPCSLPEIPERLAEWTATAVATGTVHKRAESSSTVPEDLAEYRAMGVSAGSRNVVMYRLACGLYAKYGTSGAGAEQVVSEIRDVWDKTDKQGFSWGEVTGVLESARRFIERSREKDAAARLSYLAYLSGRRTL